MAVFIVSYDAHNQRDYDDLYEAMEENSGVRLLESVWGIELDNSAAEVRDWIRGLLDDDDSILVVKIKPTPSWAARKCKKSATDWLKENVKK